MLMPEIIKTFRPRKMNRYGWNDMTDGTGYLLRRGVDFDVDPRSVYAAAKRYAARNGRDVETRVEKDVVYVRFLPRTPKKRLRIRPRIQA